MRTVEEIKAELKKKQECLDALYLHQSIKGDKLPNGQSAFDYALKYNRSIKALKEELKQAEALPDDEVIALARGTTYQSAKEKKREEDDCKKIREILGIDPPEGEDGVMSNDEVIAIAKGGW